MTAVRHSEVVTYVRRGGKIKGRKTHLGLRRLGKICFWSSHDEYETLILMAHQGRVVLWDSTSRMLESILLQSNKSSGCQARASTVGSVTLNNQQNVTYNLLGLVKRGCTLPWSLSLHNPKAFSTVLSNLKRWQEVRWTSLTGSRLNAIRRMRAKFSLQNVIWKLCRLM